MTELLSSVSPKSPENPIALLRAASTLLNRIQFFSGAGFESFNSDRKLFDALGYKQKLSISDYRSRYRRGGLARRIVNFWPHETWSGGISIVENPDTDTATQFEREVVELFTRLNLIPFTSSEELDPDAEIATNTPKLITADILAGLGEYSCIFIGIDGQDPATQLETIAGQDSILYMTPLAQDSARIKEYVDDVRNRRWGLPQYYSLNVGTNPNKRSNRKLLSSTVHWSRIIHLTHSTLESEIYGIPDLEDIWNLLDDLYKLVGGGAEASWRNARRVLHLKKDPTYTFDPESLQVLRDKINEMQHGYRDTLETSGVEIESIPQGVDNFQANANCIIGLISGTKEIPQRILLGSERGELASSQDRKNKSSVVKVRRKMLAEPWLRKIINTFIGVGALTRPEKYRIIWADENELSEEEKANLVSKYAAANKSQVEAGGTVLLTSDEIRDSFLNKGPLKEAGESESKDEENNNPEGREEEMEESAEETREAPT